MWRKKCRLWLRAFQDLVAFEVVLSGPCEIGALGCFNNKNVGTMQGTRCDWVSGLLDLSPIFG